MPSTADRRMIWRENDSWESHYDNVKTIPVRITSQKYKGRSEVEAEIFVPKKVEWKYQYMSDILYREVEEEIVDSQITVTPEAAAKKLKQMSQELAGRSCDILFSYFKEDVPGARNKYQEEFAAELNSKLISTL